MKINSKNKRCFSSVCTISHNNHSVKVTPQERLGAFLRLNYTYSGGNSTSPHTRAHMCGCPGNTHLIPHRIVGSLLSACLLYVLAAGHLHDGVETTPHELTSFEDMHTDLEVCGLVGKLLTLATSLLTTGSTPGNQKQ